jgi:GntR family transcriptional regulator
VTVFNFKLQRGIPIFEQVVFASIGAMLRGEYKAGQPFPSIRSIASDLKIHPNTAR